MYDEMKKEGAILDHKVFSIPPNTILRIGTWRSAFSTRTSPRSDGLTAKMESIRDKVLGSKQNAQQLGEKCADMRAILTTMILREVTLK